MGWNSRLPLNQNFCSTKYILKAEKMNQNLEENFATYTTYKH